MAKDTAALDAYIQRLAAEAPPLTPAQCDTIALVFAHARTPIEDRIPLDADGAEDVLDEMLGGAE